jgi:hypothetical protein
MVTMSQKSFVPQAVNSLSQVLTSDSELGTGRMAGHCCLQLRPSHFAVPRNVVIGDTVCDALIAQGIH